MNLAVLLRGPLLACALLLLYGDNVRAEDWIEHSMELEGGGEVFWTSPLSWGKKPEITETPDFTVAALGPYGPKAKPTFLVSIRAQLSIEDITAEQHLAAAKGQLEAYRQVAAETEIPLNEVEGKQSPAYYFTITDRESKYGEFDYLTLAIASVGPVLIECYFFSSDGAPEYGPDALRMIGGFRYEAEEE